MAPLPMFTFPGVGTPVAAQYAWTHGVTPGVARIQMLPEASWNSFYGDLSFFYGGKVATLTGCRVRQSTLDVSEGQTWSVSIEDRRWRWEYPTISGRYNVRRPDGQVQRKTEKTPQELAALCFQALGENGYSVGEMPNDLRPPVDWQNTLARQELDRLCVLTGCRVVPLPNGTFAIKRAGIGAAMPSGPIVSDSRSIDPSIGPDALRFVCGPTMYQINVQLEAVGLDFHNKIKPISELSYAPKDGGQLDIPGSFYRVRAADVSAWELAMRSVYKWYRITTKGLDGGPLRVPGYDKPITDRDQLLPLFATLAEEEKGVQADDPSVTPFKDAIVWGDYNDPYNYYQNTPLVAGKSAVNSDTKNECVRPYEIDTELGIVKFAEYIFLWNKTTSNGKPAIAYLPATLALRVACVVRPVDTWAVERYRKEKKRTTTLGTKPFDLVRDEVQLRVWNSWNGGKVQTNKEDVNKQADYYLAQAEQEYMVKTPQTRSFQGLILFPLDGAISEVAWELKVGDFATTHVSRNTERSGERPGFWERRRLDAQKEEWGSNRGGNLP